MTTEQREPLSPQRERFAHTQAQIGRAWDEADPIERMMITRICPALAVALDSASRAIDELLDVEGPGPDGSGTVDLQGAVSHAVTEQPRPTRCPQVTKIPTHGNSRLAHAGVKWQDVICGEPLNEEGHCRWHPRPGHI